MANFLGRDEQLPIGVFEHMKKPADQDPKPPSKGGFAKSLLEVLDVGFSVVYKFSIGMGALVVLLYLTSIRFYPALSASEVVLLVLLATMFGFIFTIALLYGSLACLWILSAVEVAMASTGRYRENPDARRRKALRKRVAAERAKKNSKLIWLSHKLRKLIRTNQVGKLPVRSLRPKFARGVMPQITSLFIFLFALLAFYEITDTRRLIIGAVLAGFTLLLVGGSVFRAGDVKTSPAQVEPKAVAKFLLWALVASTIVFVTFAGLSPPVNLAVASLGLRTASATVEVGEAEGSRLAMVSDALSFPVVDCRPASKGKILVHYADVPWHGVGEISRFEFSIPGDREPLPGLGREKAWKSAAISVDANGTTIIATSPRLAQCLPYSTKALYVKETADISSSGERLVESMLRMLDRHAPIDGLRAVFFVAHESDIPLADERALALTQQLRRLTDMSGMQIATEVSVGRPLRAVMPDSDVEIWVGSSGIPLSRATSRNERHTGR